MTAIQTIRAAIKPELDLLNEHIAATLHSPNELMNSVVAEYLRAKGKQIRPILVLLSAKLFTPQDQPLPKSVVEAAAAAEMLHNASLIHDDVVDESKLRRGNPTINSVWDNHVAVLMGDFFVSSSLQEAIATGDIRIVGALARLGRLLSIGEMDQICNARFHQLTEEDYLRVIGRKTASLFEACVEMGAFAAGAKDDDPRLALLRRFAHLLGLCFQIRDDIFDYYSDGNIGKPTGNDLREGKITLPLIYALTRADHPRRQEMLELSRREVLDTDTINTLIEYAKQAGGIDYARSQMESMHHEAAQLLSQLPDVPERRSFMDIFDFIITRDN